MSRQAVTAADHFAQLLDIPEFGSGSALELLKAAKVAKFAALTQPEGWTFRDWLKVCQDEFFQTVAEM